MTSPIGPPPNPLAGRQRYLIGFLQVAVVVVFALAMLALVLPGDLAPDIARAMVAVLVAGPAVRVTWLTIRWARLGDHRFALAGLVLLGVMASGVLLSQ